MGIRVYVQLVAVAAVAALAACGGKIADDPNALPPAAAVPSAPAPAPVMDVDAAVDDPCTVVCRRNGQCGALQTGCVDECTSEVQGSGGCSDEASAFYGCYAANLQPACAEVPPVCQVAYCAYTACTGKISPSYC